ncbi:MAG: DUF6036 family nucleotidyltransferase [Acidimicrobiaceae bacterium]|nr:DUF6036 family nucleotidyltransferase [Acidimicrobiaceae bacterium]
MTGALPSRTFEEMVELLDELNVSLEGSTPTGTRYTLFVVGGIAMGALFESRATQDVDVVSETIPKAVRKAARSVAKKHRIPDSWINNDAADIVNANLPFSAFQSIYSREHVEVLAPGPEHLLALKLMSGRDKDIGDLVMLAEHVGVSSPAEMLDICDRVYAHTPGYANERGFVESVCRDIAPIVQSHLAGKDVTDEVRLLADSLSGFDVEPGLATRDMKPRRGRKTRRSRVSSAGKCAAKTRDGGRCSHPKPRIGARCAAGHLRAG